jgi:Glycosyltransferase family 87
MRFRPRSAVLCALLILLGSSYFFFGIFIPGLRPGLAVRNLAGGYRFGNDLYPIWVAGGELFHKRNPYAPELTARIETGLYGRPLDRRVPVDAAVNSRRFSYPVYTIFLLAPLVPMSFPSVQVVLAIVLPCMAGLTVLLWLRILGTGLSRSGTMVALCLVLASFPVLEGIYAGQPGLISAAIIAGTIAALVGERFVLAGVLLPWASIKPQLIVLLALWLVVWSLSDWTRRKRFFFSFAATSLVMLAATTWLMPHWVASWLRTLREYLQISPPPLAQFVLGRYPGIVVALALLTVSLRLCWRARHEDAHSERFAFATSFLLAATVLVLTSAIAIYDQFLLLPGALWVYTHRDRILRGSLAFRLLTLITMAAVSWPWFSAIGLILLHQVSPAIAHTPAALLLPLRTEASIPFAFTGLLCFVAFRELRPQAGR